MEWLPKILECNVPVLTVHLRTRKEMSKVPAHWEIMPEVVKLVRHMTGEVKDGGTIVIGNGDVLSVGEAKEKCKQTGCDGVMIGKGVFGAPWLFSARGGPASGGDVRKRLEILVEHTKLFEEKLGDIKSFAIMKKHFKAYVNGFDGAKELRMELMECENSKEVEEIVEKFLENI
jgi:tRNA-dihydrouridine synthase